MTIGGRKSLPKPELNPSPSRISVTGSLFSYSYFKYSAMVKLLIIKTKYMATTKKKIIKNATDDVMHINSVAEQVIDHVMQAKKMYKNLDPKTKKKILQGLGAAAAAITAIGLMKKMTTKEKAR